MKEFWIFKQDGSSYIEYCNDLSDLHIPQDARVEEIDYEVPQNRKLSAEEEEYYEKCYEELIAKEIEDEKEETLNTEYIKVDKLIEFQVRLTEWDKKFVFGIKRNLNNKSKISLRQKEILDKIYTKTFKYCA